MTKAEEFQIAQEKVAKYDRQTAALVKRATKYFGDVHSEHFTLPEMTYFLRESYKELLTHSKVLHENKMRQRGDWSTGFCFTTSYLIYQMTGGDKVWEIYVAPPLHCWLVHRDTGKICDVTYSQFEKPGELRIYYENGSLFKDIDKYRDQLETQADNLAKCAGLKPYAETGTDYFTGHDI